MGGTGNDTFEINNAGDVITEVANTGSNTEQTSVSATLAANVQNLTGTGTAALTLTGNTLANVITANSGADTLVAGAGIAMLASGTGIDTFIVNNSSDAITVSSAKAGNVVQSSVNYVRPANLAGAGASTLKDTGGANVLVGGAGGDAITLGAGTAVVAFNSGDGAATIATGAGLANTLSLGGGIAYSNLAFSKSGNNLILNTGGSNAITFTNWYAGAADQNFVTLQMLEQATSTYSATSTNVLYNEDVEEFNFTALVTAFNAALAATPTLTSWSLMNSLLNDHLSGSNTTAMGGDLGYYEGLNGNLTGMNLATAVSTLQSTSFGKTAQTIDAWSGISAGSNKLR
jgi:hypothetical protein